MDTILMHKLKWNCSKILISSSTFFRRCRLCRNKFCQRFISFVLATSEDVSCYGIWCKRDKYFLAFSRMHSPLISFGYCSALLFKLGEVLQWNIFFRDSYSWLLFKWNVFLFFTSALNNTIRVNRNIQEDLNCEVTSHAKIYLKRHILPSHYVP